MSGYVVIDASVAVKWVVPEEDAAHARRLYVEAKSAEVAIVVPPHFPVEVTNALRKKTWRHELSSIEAADVLQQFLAHDYSIAVPPQLHAQALDLANRYDRRAVYDSHYVALAEIFGCELWTADHGIVNGMGGDLPFIRLLRDYI